MQPILALAVIILLAVTAIGAETDLYAHVGRAASAAAVAAWHNVNTRARAFHGHSTAEDGNLGSVSATDRLKFAAQLRDELVKLFAERPEQLAKIQQAWNDGERRGFQEDPSTISSFQQPAVNGYLESPPSSPGPASNVPTATQEAFINRLYESDFPFFQSRMDELVRGRGYPLERHTAVTEDGYELAMFRIPYGRYRNKRADVKKPVVLLHHGVTLASDCFLVLNANESLGFILADAGFDVWFANTRGNTYSRNNTQGRLPYQQQFWYFSMDELALQDLPTQVDYILQKTGASKLAFTGHSQGCTLAYMLCAARPEYNSKFSVITHLGPVFFVRFFRAPVLRLLATYSLDQLLYALGIGEFIPNRLTAPLAGILCSSWPASDLCAAAVSLVFFGPSQFITPDDYAVISRTWPSSVGSRNLVHWAQNFRSSDLELRQYDFGLACNLTKWTLGQGFRPKAFFETCNQLKYGSTEPPIYDLRRVTAPNVFFLGNHDIVAVPEDVLEQQSRLGSSLTGAFLYPAYGHMDFIWDRNARHAADLVETFFRYSSLGT
eukprot:gene11744-11889_t